MRSVNQQGAAMVQISSITGAQRLLFLLGLLLTWPLLLNGGPVLFSDTTSYIRAADAVAVSTGVVPKAWLPGLLNEIDCDDAVTENDCVTGVATA